MSRKPILVTILFLFFQLSLPASPHSQWWEAGKRYYAAKQYDSAAFYFEKIAALRPADAVVYYNLGNTYYRLNQIGPAALNYERALKIKPGYQEAKDNLTLTQARIPNRLPVAEDIFFVRWWKGLTASSSAGLWSVISLLLFLSLITTAILKVLGKLTFSPSRIQAALAAAWLLTLIFAFSAAARKNRQAAVVMEAGASLVNSSKGGKSIGSIPEGTTVDIQQEEQGMTEVQLPDGRSGWIESSALSKI